MNIANKYFIIAYPINKDILNKVIETQDTIRLNNTRDKCIVKLPVNCLTVPKELSEEKIYTHSEILDVINRDPQWMKSEL